MVQLAHKILLYPNCQAAICLSKACGTARFAYNWALARWKQKYKSGERSMSGFSLVKELNAVKAQEFPWMTEVTKWASQKAVQDLGYAFKRFFKGKNRYPKFKRKHGSRDSFYLGIGCFSIKGKYLRVPKLGWIRMAQEVRFPGEFRYVVISRDGDRWYASVSVRINESRWSYAHRCKSQAVVGIDLGISSLATTSNGEKFGRPSSLRFDRRLKKAHKVLSRRQKGSRRREKAKLALAKMYHKTKEAKADWTHRFTSKIVKSYRLIRIEDLNVRGMMKNRRLARAIGNATWGEIRRQLQYKVFLSGSSVVVAGRFFPSSKLCSNCGAKTEKMPLGLRKWTCGSCVARHDRDLNAAINLRDVARGYRETLSARGGDVRPDGLGHVAALGKREAMLANRSEVDNSHTQNLNMEDAMRPVKRKRKKRRRKKPSLLNPGDRTEGSPPELSYRKLDSEKGGPSNPTAIPSGLRGISAYDDLFVAWVKKNCKFARS